MSASFLNKMQSYMTVLHVLLVIQCLATSSHAIFRIIGGHKKNIEDVPYQLSLRKNGFHICGAALISNKYALSAAHCFKTTGAYSVRAGSADRDSGGIIVNIKNAMLHPKHVYNQYEYDIIILELEHPLPLSNKIKPIKLPENGKLLKPGMKGLVSGFGLIHESDKTGSQWLRAAEVIVQNKNLCLINYMQYGVRLNTLVFCAGVPDGNRDSCQGDSGGPFVVDEILYGLVSFGLDCGDSKYPGVYVSVPEFRDFINVNTGI